ncbi:MAG: hypothetical protein ACLQB1_04515 [Streptosporangiaceae bacterium]
MFHKLEHLPDLADFLTFMAHAVERQGVAFQSVKKRFPCVTRVSRALAATTEEARGTGHRSLVHSTKPRKLGKERDRVSPT